MWKKTCLILCVILIVSVLSPSTFARGRGRQTSAARGGSSEAIEKFDGPIQPEEERVLTLVNLARKAAGLPVLMLDRVLHLQARRHSNWMARSGMIHSSDPVAENIAINSTPESTVNAWMNSSGHRANILGGYQHAGVAVKNGYWTIQFH